LGTEDCFKKQPPEGQRSGIKGRKRGEEGEAKEGGDLVT